MLFAVPSQIGYVALAGFVLGESAGVPIPGETALVAAGLLAASGRLSLPVVILVAAAAAIVGDNLGYAAGRRGGRPMLLRDGRFAGHRRRALELGDRFFARHGAKAVFLGRWISGVRIVAAMLAGATEMPRRTFMAYNAAGAFTWAATVAGAAALLGPAVVAGLYLAGLVAAAGLLTHAAWRRRHPATGREAVPTPSPEGDATSRG